MRANRNAANERVGIDFPSGPALVQRAFTNIMEASVFFYQNSQRAIYALCVGALKGANATLFRRDAIRHI